MRDENTVRRELIGYRQKVVLLENELLAIERDLALQDYGVEIDSIVVVDNEEYLVTEVRYIWKHSLPSLMGRKKTMGGDWGKRERHVYGKWEIKDEEKTR